MEISSGFRQRARAFNLDEAELRATVLEPWVQGRRVHLGEKDFEPKDSKLVVLEGPELADVDLSIGRGWSNAEKASENVTRRLVESASVPAKPVVAILAEEDAARAEVAGMLTRLELELAPWDDLRSRILGAPPAQGAAPAGSRTSLSSSTHCPEDWRAGRRPSRTRPGIAPSRSSPPYRPRTWVG